MPAPVRPQPTAGRRFATRTAALLLLALVSLGAQCPPGDIQHPKLTRNSQNFLAAYIDFDTEVAVVPRVTVHGPDGDWDVPGSGVLSPAPGLTHRVLVIGLEAGNTYGFTVGDAAGELEPDTSLSYTPSLPANFPSIEIRVSEPAARSPGYTLLAINQISVLRTWIVLLDADGDPRWYWTKTGSVGEGVTGLQRLPNGDVAYATFDWKRLRFIDLAGNMTERTALSMGLDSFHHDLSLTPAGNLLTLSTELRLIAGYPGTGGPLNIVGDVISELTEDGAVLRQWKLLDLLDPHRLLHPENSSFYAGVYPGVSNLKDWSHGNGVFYDASDDSLVVSSLHQEMLFKLDAATGELLWALGEDDPASAGDDAWPFLALVGPGTFPVRHHSAHVVDGHLVQTYDNGLGKSGSRGLGIDVDADALSYTETFSWKDPDYSPPLVGPIGGDCDLLPNGNFMVFDGSTAGGERLSEVEPDGTKVFEAVFPGAISFKAEAVDSIYPSG